MITRASSRPNVSVAMCCFQPFVRFPASNPELASGALEEVLTTRGSMIAAVGSGDRPACSRTLPASSRGSPRWSRRLPIWRNSHTRSCTAGNHAAGAPTRSRSGSRTRPRSRSRGGHGSAPSGPGRPRHARPAIRTGPARSAPTGHQTGHRDKHADWSRRRFIAADTRELWDLEGKDLTALRHTGITWDQMPSETKPER